jgi:hypothetical protein
VRRGSQWLDYVNAPQADAEVKRQRKCVQRGRPFGATPWMKQTAADLGLEASLRPREEKTGHRTLSLLFRPAAKKKKRDTVPARGLLFHESLNRAMHLIAACSVFGVHRSLSHCDR